VSRYQKKHSPTHHPDHHPIFISFFHLPRSTASSLFKLRASQSLCTTSLHVLFGLPLGLEPSTSYSTHLLGRAGRERKGLGIGMEEKEVSKRSIGWMRRERDGWDENERSLYSKIATTPLPEASSYVMHAVYCKFTLYFDCNSWLLS